MKLMIASDLHGSAYYTQALLRRMEDEKPAKLVLLGDILYHGPRNALPRDYDTKACAAMLNALEKAPLCIRGNCDGEVDQMVLNFPLLADFAAVFADGYTPISRTATISTRRPKPPPPATSCSTDIPMSQRSSRRTGIIM